MIVGLLGILACGALRGPPAPIQGPELAVTAVSLDTGVEVTLATGLLAPVEVTAIEWRLAPQDGSSISGKAPPCAAVSPGITARCALLEGWPEGVAPVAGQVVSVSGTVWWRTARGRDGATAFTIRSTQPADEVRQ